MRALAGRLRDARAAQSYGAQAVGHMEALWAWAWGRTDDGDLTGFEPEDIAGAAKWRGDAGAFIAMLVDVGYLDRTRGRLRLHDADEHRPDYVRKRIQERRRRGQLHVASGWHDEHKWLQRVAVFGWRCAYCHVALTVATLTKDHVIPVSRGGSSWPSNLVPACLSCNSGKRDSLWRPRYRAAS